MSCLLAVRCEDATMWAREDLIACVRLWLKPAALPELYDRSKASGLLIPETGCLLNMLVRWRWLFSGSQDRCEQGEV